MAILLIEIGNTALKAAWAEGMTLGKTYRYQGEKVMEFILSITEKEKAEVMAVISAGIVAGRALPVQGKTLHRVRFRNHAHHRPDFGNRAIQGRKRLSRIHDSIQGVEPLFQIATADEHPFPYPP